MSSLINGSYKGNAFLPRFTVLIPLIFVPTLFSQGQQVARPPVDFPAGVVPPPDETHAMFKIGMCGTRHFEPRLEFCDSRDEQIYRYVKMGTQTWMADNLNFGKMVSGSTDQTDPGQKYCLHDKLQNCAALYQWAEAVGLNFGYNAKTANLKGKIQGICPSGWHVPSSGEWDTLGRFVDTEQGGESEARSLMYQSRDDDFKWKTNSTPDTVLPSNRYGFEIVSTGQRLLRGTCPVGPETSSYFCSAHDAALFWTADDGLGNTDPNTGVNITFTEDVPQFANSSNKYRQPSTLSPAQQAALQQLEALQTRIAANQSGAQRTYKESQKLQGMALRCVKN